MTLASASSNSVMDGIVERQERGLIVLSPACGRTRRRILHVNSYGGAFVWDSIKRGDLPAHQLLGCLELVRLGYEVALADALPHFDLYRRPFPHDLRLLRMAKSWLRPDDILFCGHTLLYWLPLVKSLGALNRRLVSMIYAREHLDLARAHSGIIALTPAAADQARKLAPNVKVAHLGWGGDTRFFPKLPYNPEWFFSCGIANRDFRTLSAASSLCSQPIRVICPGELPGLSWPSNVTLVDGGSGWLISKTKKLTVRDLVTHHYPRSAATMVIIKNDPAEYTANGFTNLIEAMSIGQPVIVTRTGALPGELDVEKAGCGLHIPPDNPAALADAIKTLAADPRRAEAMGLRGRQLVDSHYSLGHYADRLHRFFETL